VLPFSRRVVPVNLFSYLRMQMTPRSTRTFRPISNNDIIIQPNDDDKVTIDKIEDELVKEIDGDNKTNEGQQYV